MNRKNATAKKTAYHALSKIRSIIFNMAQEHRIGALELDDFNDAFALASEALNELGDTIESVLVNLKTAENHRNAWIEKYDKLSFIAQLLGLNTNGVKELEEYPVEFLKSITMAMKKHKTPLRNDGSFWLIRLQYAWLQRKIESDNQALQSAKLFKKIYAAAPKNSPVKQIALNAMQQIAEDHKHILDDIRTEKKMNEIQTKIINHWYVQLSTHNFAKAETC